MAHCLSCGKEVIKPLRELKNSGFTVKTYNCKKCNHYFKVQSHSQHINVHYMIPICLICLANKLHLAGWHISSSVLWRSSFLQLTKEITNYKKESNCLP